MKVLIKKAIIIEPGKGSPGKKVDILIKDGIITAVEKDIEVEGAQTLEFDNLHVSPGWIDLGTQHGEPGFEQRETLESLALSAVNGGYTALAVAPNTDPPVQRRSEIDSLLKKSENLPVHILPVGAATENCEGQNLNEYMDMAKSGAIAFSDGRRPITDSGTLSRTLIYASAANKPIINRPLQMSFSPFGIIHEGKQSLKLGLEGIPAEAETIALQQDLSVFKYSGGKLIELGISSENSIALLKNKPEGFYCGVAAMNILFTDDELKEFNTYCKVMPPLRAESDKNALIHAIKNGEIDFIFSNHDPGEAEIKDVEFGAAAFGASTLDNCFSMAWTALKGHLQLTDFIQLICHNPYRALQLTPPNVKPGSEANLTLFDPDKEVVFQKADLQSLSSANPALNRPLVGQVYGTIIGKSLNFI